MGGEAGYSRRSAGGGWIGRISHSYSCAPPLDLRGGGGVRLTIAAYFRRMAAAAVIAERGRKHSHRIHELIDGNAFQHTNILKNGIRRLRSRILPGLARYRHKAQ